MEETVGFNQIEQVEATNKTLEIIYTPDSSMIRLEYRVLVDGVEVDFVEGKTDRPLYIVLDKSGSYQIEIKEFNHYNQAYVIQSGVYNIDKEAPVITVSSNLIELQLGSDYDFLADVSVVDHQDGDLKDKLITNEAQLNLLSPGIQTLIYTVEDSAGNIATKQITIHIMSKTSSSLLFFQILFVIVIMTFVAGIMRYRRSVALEKRIGKYGVDPIKDTSLSIVDQAHNLYFKAVRTIRKYIQKSVFITRYAKRYERYLAVADQAYDSGLDIVSSKCIIAFILLMVAVFSKTTQLEVMSVYEICFPLLFGFFLLDIVYWSKYRMYRKQIENDFLQAIIIMNNAFKSGRSIMQAISLVSTELEGPIAEEFKMMHLEMTFGLPVDVIFKHFADRIQLEEVTYVTASLTILNKTGGNIIKVFSAIEKTLFNKRKLKIEMVSLTGSSRIIVYALFAVPILFVLFISIINPSYFLPLITTQLGYYLLAIIIVMYVVYIFFISKIMKVRI